MSCNETAMVAGHPRGDFSRFVENSLRRTPQAVGVGLCVACAFWHENGYLVFFAGVSPNCWAVKKIRYAL